MGVYALNQHEDLLRPVWSTYLKNTPKFTLGQCIRMHIQPFDLDEHQSLSNMDGEVALQYFNLHYVRERK